MNKQQVSIADVRPEKIVGGGQALGTLSDGRKAFVWGGLPGETVTMQLTKKKARYVEGYVVAVTQPSTHRIDPHDPLSYLSTSPWQIMTFDQEQHYKAALIEEAFELHDIVLPEAIEVYTDFREYEYRNKVEFSWWWDTQMNRLDLAFFRRGTHGKIPVSGTSLAHPAINEVARAVRDVLRQRSAKGYDLKTLLLRCDRGGNVVGQLYVKNDDFALFSDSERAQLSVKGFQIIFSNPKSPASIMTHQLQTWGEMTLQDEILSVPFRYPAESFFQINLPVYEQALRDMQEWVIPGTPVIDLYSGVGTIGLTIGGKAVTLVESNEAAVKEMQRNIAMLHRDVSAKAVLSPSETAIDYITGDATIIVDPPRAGLHDGVIAELLAKLPPRIIYLSCNPVTQARDTAKLAASYGIRAHRGYNFFPRTPHIEHLVLLDLKTKT